MERKHSGQDLYLQVCTRGYLVHLQYRATFYFLPYSLQLQTYGELKLATGGHSTIVYRGMFLHVKFNNYLIIM